MSNRDTNQSKGWRTTQNCSVKTPKGQILKKIIASKILLISKLNRKFSVVKRTVYILLVSTGTFFRIQVIRNMGYTFTPITCDLILCMYTETPPSSRDVVLRWKGREKRPGSPGTAYVLWRLVEWIRLCFLLVHEQSVRLSRFTFEIKFSL